MLRLTAEGVEIAKEEELPTASPFLFPFVHCTISLHPDTPPHGLEELPPSPSFHKPNISPRPNSFPPNSRYKEQIHKNTNTTGFCVTLHLLLCQHRLPVVVNQLESVGYKCVPGQ